MVSFGSSWPWKQVPEKTIWHHWLYLLIVLCVLALIVWVAVLVSQMPDIGFSWSWAGEIAQVIPSGPGARAGLRAGDMILKWDGIPFSVSPWLYTNKELGQSVVFTVLRNDGRHSISVTIVSASVWVILSRLTPLLVAASLWAVSLVTTYLKPITREGRLFFLYAQVGAAILAAGELTTLSVTWATGLFNVLLCLFSPLFVHFHLVFSFPRMNTCRRLLLGCCYMLSLVFALPHIAFSPSHVMMLPWYPLLRLSIRVLLVLSLLGSVSLLLYVYLSTQDPRLRRQVRLIILGTGFALVPLTTLSVLPEILTGLPFLPYEISFLFLLLIPIAYAVAIYKYNLLGIDRFLNRSLVHFVLGLLWVASYLILTMLTNALLPPTVRSRPLLVALVTLMIALALMPLRQKLQGWIDRAFYGGWYDYRSVVAGVSTVLAEARDETTLVEQLVHRVAQTMGLHSAVLFLANEPGALALRGYTGTGCPVSQAHISLGMSLPLLLQQEARPLERDDIRQRLAGKPLSEAEREWLTAEQARLWVPLVFRDRLHGILVMGNKRAEDFFDAEDVRILETLAHQAGMAAENIFLLASLRHQVEELTALRDELETTHRRMLTNREEERNRVARELHDRLLQELLALNIGLRSASDSSGETAVDRRLSAMRQDVLHLADETRRICAELRPPALSIMGLADAIRSYTHEQTDRWDEDVRVIGGFSDEPPGTQATLTITLDLDQDRKRLSDEVAITLFRVYQEALANVEKHAAAQNVWVTERLADGTVSLCIRDDGCGFTVLDHPGHLARQGHFGLIGIHERVATIGGEARIISQPGAGTEISVSAPTDGKESPE